MAEKNEIKKEKTNRSFSGLRGIFSRMQQRMQQNKMLRQDEVLSDLNKQLRNIKGIYLPTEEDKMNVAQLTETIRNRENELIGEMSAEPIRGIVEDVPVSNTRSDVVFGNKNMPKTAMPSIEEIIVSAQPRMPSLEEITVSAEKRPMPPQKPAFNVASKLGRNQLKSLQKRAARMRRNPDAYVRNPDYAIEFLPDYLQEKYRDELMQLAGQYAGGGLMDIKQQTQNVAAQGRYGDSMLMHVNPAEVRGLSQVMPLTVNPETGQPEAFLPFLAPLAGSLLGGSFLAGVGGMSALTASALGSGLAQWAATGDFKKGLLAGVTGYGVGTALEGASAASDAAGAADAAAASTEAAMAGANPLTSTLPDISGINPAITTATDFATSTPLQNTFSGGFQEGLGNLATGFSDPLAMTAMYGGMAPTAMMESEEAYLENMRRMQEEEEESRRQNFLNTPEPILYSAGGGSTNMDPSVQADIELLSMMADGGRTGYRNGGPMGMPDFNNFSGDQQRFTPARQAYAVNPDFLAGFAPETMYFQPNTLNQPATATTTGGAPVLEDTYEGSKGGFGGVQAMIAPTTTINPYEQFTGSAPAGLEFVQPEVAPIPDVPVDTPPPVTPPTTPPVLPPDFPPINWDDILGNIDMPNINFDDIGIDYPFNFDMNTTMPNVDMPMVDTPMVDMPVNEDIDYSNFMDFYKNQPRIKLPLSESNMVPDNIPLMPDTPMDMPINIPEMLSPEMPMPISLAPETNEIMADPNVSLPFQEEIDRLNNRIRIDDSPVFVDPLNMKPPSIEEVLDDDEVILREEIVSRPEPEPKRKVGRRKRIGRGGRAVGGSTDSESMLIEIVQKDPLASEVVQFVLGNSDNQEVIPAFVEKYGNELFLQLREAVLQELAPDAQTEGLIEGVGNGGMDDDINGIIGDKEKIAVSQDEFIIPADVVSMLGDGSSQAGSEELYGMMDRVRQTKTGTTKQAPRLANKGGLLPA